MSDHVNEVTVHRQTASARKQARRARKFLARRKHGRKYVKAGWKLRGKRKAAVRRLKSQGFYKKIARLRSSLDLPATVVGSIQHHPDYISMVLAEAADKKKQRDAEWDPRKFATHFLKKDPVYSASNTGMSAVMFEAFVMEAEDEWCKSFIETIVEGPDTTFLAIFENKLKQKDIDALNEKMGEYFKATVLVNKGDIAHDDGIVSDITIIECAPAAGAGSKAKAEIERRKKQTTDGNIDNLEALPQTKEDYEQVQKEGGLTDNAFQMLYAHAQKDKQGEINVAEDHHEVMWYQKDDGCWYPDISTFNGRVDERRKIVAPGSGEPVYVCNYCGNEVDTTRAMVRKYGMKRKDFKCSECGHKDWSVEYMEPRKRTSSSYGDDESIDEARKLKCSDCKKFKKSVGSYQISIGSRKALCKECATKRGILKTSLGTNVKDLPDESLDEGKNQRGKRDGTGPFKGSYMARTGNKKGRRKQAGEPCPYEASFTTEERANNFARAIRPHVRTIIPSGTKVYYETKDTTDEDILDELCKKHMGKKKKSKRLTKKIAEAETLPGTDSPTALPGVMFSGTGDTEDQREHRKVVLATFDPKQQEVMYHESEGELKSKFDAWVARKEGTDDGKTLVALRGQVYTLPRPLSEVKELVEKIAKYYEGLPEEFDMMVEAYFAEYLPDNGEVCEANGMSQVQEDMAEQTLRGAKIDERDDRIASNASLRRAAMGLPLDEALGKSDRAVINAFTDKKPADGKKLTTDGKRLDGNWTGGRGIAVWDKGKIHFNDLGSKAAQSIQNAVKKNAAPNDLAEEDLDEFTPEQIARMRAAKKAAPNRAPRTLSPAMKQAAQRKERQQARAQRINRLRDRIAKSKKSPSRGSAMDAQNRREKVSALQQKLRRHEDQQDDLMAVMEELASVLDYMSADEFGWAISEASDIVEEDLDEKRQMVVLFIPKDKMDDVADALQKAGVNPTQPETTAGGGSSAMQLPFKTPGEKAKILAVAKRFKIPKNVVESAASLKRAVKQHGTLYSKRAATRAEVKADPALMALERSIWKHIQRGQYKDDTYQGVDSFEMSGDDVPWVEPDLPPDVFRRAGWKLTGTAGGALKGYSKVYRHPKSKWAFVADGLDYVILPAGMGESQNTVSMTPEVRRWLNYIGEEDKYVGQTADSGGNTMFDCPKCPWYGDGEDLAPGNKCPRCGYKFPKNSGGTGESIDEAGVPPGRRVGLKFPDAASYTKFKRKYYQKFKMVPKELSDVKGDGPISIEALAPLSTDIRRIISMAKHAGGQYNESVDESDPNWSKKGRFQKGNKEHIKQVATWGILARVYYDDMKEWNMAVEVLKRLSPKGWKKALKMYGDVEDKKQHDKIRAQAAPYWEGLGKAKIKSITRGIMGKKYDESIDEVAVSAREKKIAKLMQARGMTHALILPADKGAPLYAPSKALAMKMKRDEYPDAVVVSIEKITMEKADEDLDEGLESMLRDALNTALELDDGDASPKEQAAALVKKAKFLRSKSKKVEAILKAKYKGDYYHGALNALVKLAESEDDPDDDPEGGTHRPFVSDEEWDPYAKRRAALRKKKHGGFIRRTARRIGQAFKRGSSNRDQEAGHKAWQAQRKKRGYESVTEVLRQEAQFKREYAYDNKKARVGRNQASRIIMRRGGTVVNNKKPYDPYGIDKERWITFTAPDEKTLKEIKGALSKFIDMWDKPTTESLDEKMTMKSKEAGRKVTEPTHMKALAAEYGVSDAEALKYWGKAQAAADKQYPDLKKARKDPKKGRRYYMVVTAIFKNMLKGAGSGSREQAGEAIQLPPYGSIAVHEAKFVCTTCEAAQHEPYTFTRDIRPDTFRVHCPECKGHEVVPTGEYTTRYVNEGDVAALRSTLRTASITEAADVAHLTPTLTEREQENMYAQVNESAQPHNYDWGLLGELERNDPDTQLDVFQMIRESLQARFKATPVQARRFLDSCHGRYLMRAIDEKAGEVLTKETLQTALHKILKKSAIKGAWAKGQEIPLDLDDGCDDLTNLWERERLYKLVDSKGAPVTTGNKVVSQLMTKTEADDKNAKDRRLIRHGRKWELVEAKVQTSARAKKFAKELLDKSTGKSQVDFGYRVLLRALIQGQPHAHLYKLKDDKGKGAKKAREDLLYKLAEAGKAEKAESVESVDEAKKKGSELLYPGEQKEAKAAQKKGAKFVIISPEGDEWDDFTLVYVKSRSAVNRWKAEKGYPDAKVMSISRITGESVDEEAYEALSIYLRKAPRSAGDRIEKIIMRAGGEVGDMEFGRNYGDEKPGWTIEVTSPSPAVTKKIEKALKRYEPDIDSETPPAMEPWDSEDDYANLSEVDVKKLEKMVRADPKLYRKWLVSKMPIQAFAKREGLKVEEALSPKMAKLLRDVGVSPEAYAKARAKFIAKGKSKSAGTSMECMECGAKFKRKKLSGEVKCPKCGSTDVELGESLDEAMTATFDSDSDAKKVIGYILRNGGKARQKGSSISFTGTKADKGDILQMIRDAQKKGVVKKGAKVSGAAESVVEGYQHVHFKDSKPIRFKAKMAGKEKSVQGRTFGKYIVIHPTTGGKGDTWTISHIQSGMALASRIEDDRVAVRAVKKLEALGSIWDFSDPADMPPDLKDKALPIVKGLPRKRLMASVDEALIDQIKQAARKAGLTTRQGADVWKAMQKYSSVLYGKPDLARVAKATKLEKPKLAQFVMAFSKIRDADKKKYESLDETKEYTDKKGRVYRASKIQITKTPENKGKFILVRRESQYLGSAREVWDGSKWIASKGVGSEEDDGQKFDNARKATAVLKKAMDEGYLSPFE